MPYSKDVDLSEIMGGGFDPATDTLEKLRDELREIEGPTFNPATDSIEYQYNLLYGIKIVADKFNFTGANVDSQVANKGILNDLSAANINTEVDNALNTAIPGSPTAGSINDVIKDVDSKDLGVPIITSPTDDLLFSNDIERTSSSGIYAILKQITCGTSGDLRIKFDLKSSSPNMAYGKIYKNGIEYGTERTDITQSYVNFSEDLKFLLGDTIEIWVKHSADTTFIRNFRVHGIITHKFYNDLT